MSVQAKPAPVPDVVGGGGIFAQPGYVTKHTGATPKGSLDAPTLAMLESTHRFSLLQGNALSEALSLGCCGNMYVLTDKDTMVSVAGRDEQAEKPIFVMEEEASCCCRCWCPGNYPATVKYYNAMPVQAGKTKCGCYQGHNYPPNKQGGAVMTFERDGCCTKCQGCFICPCCPDYCRDQAWLHGGDTDDINSHLNRGKLNQDPSANVLGRSHMPLDGGCFTPTLDMFNMSKDPSAAPFAYAEGPCCFGGCVDFCIDVQFAVSSDPQSKAADLGYIKKLMPEGCWGKCVACATDVDNFEVVTPTGMDPIEKAIFLNTALHLDYAFFENDNRFCDVQDNGDGSGVIYITLFTWYCRGMMLPCMLCLPYGQDG